MSRPTPVEVHQFDATTVAFIPYGEMQSFSAASVSTLERCLYGLTVPLDGPPPSGRRRQPKHVGRQIVSDVVANESGVQIRFVKQTLVSDMPAAAWDAAMGFLRANGLNDPYDCEAWKSRHAQQDVVSTQPQTSGPKPTGGDLLNTLHQKRIADTGVSR